MSELLKIIWQEQEEYNAKIKRLEDVDTAEHWTQIYLLGMISEVDELLSLVNWKRNKKYSLEPIDRASLAMELADITKFVLSLWQLWGFTQDQMLSTIAAKNEILDFMLHQELAEPPKDKNVLVCDLDGVIADWRFSFIMFLQDNYGSELAVDAAKSLHIDTDLNLSYSEYQPYKEQFERDGGYGDIRPYACEIQTVKHLQKDQKFHLIIVTARPYKVYKRIWIDTWQWLRRTGIKPDELHFVGYDRIIMANALRERGCNVIMFEDDPHIIRRAANDKIKIICKAQPYNEEVQNGTNIFRVEEITAEDVRRFLTTKYHQLSKTD